MRNNIEELGRNEQNVGTAEVSLVVKFRVLVEIIPYVFALIHQNSVFFVVKKDWGDTGRAEMTGACVKIAASGQNDDGSRGSFEVEDRRKI